MHVMLIPMGSMGDVYPLVGLGAALRSRGWTKPEWQPLSAFAADIAPHAAHPSAAAAAALLAEARFGGMPFRQADFDAAIKRLAKGNARSPSEVVSEAIEQMLAERDDLSVELARWAEYERTGEAIGLEVARKRLKARLKPPTRRRRAASK